MAASPPLHCTGAEAPEKVLTESVSSRTASVDDTQHCTSFRYLVGTQITALGRQQQPTQSKYRPCVRVKYVPHVCN